MVFHGVSQDSTFHISALQRSSPRAHNMLFQVGGVFALASLVGPLRRLPSSLANNRMRL